LNIDDKDKKKTREKTRKTPTTTTGIVNATTMTITANQEIKQPPSKKKPSHPRGPKERPTTEPPIFLCQKAIFA